MVCMSHESPFNRISFVLCQSPRLFAPLIPWSWRDPRLVKIRSWSFSPPYRRTGGSETVAKEREAEGMVRRRDVEDRDDARRVAVVGRNMVVYWLCSDDEERVSYPRTIKVAKWSIGERGSREIMNGTAF